MEHSPVRWAAINLNQFKKTEITSSIFSNQKDIKLGINRRKIHKYGKIKQHIPEQPMDQRLNQKVS